MVALQADVADGDVGEEIEVGLHHADAGAQDGHDDERLGKDASGEGLQRRVHGVAAHGQVAGGLEGEHEADLTGEGAEGRGLGGVVAQVGERVGGEGVAEEVEHGKAKS